MDHRTPYARLRKRLPVKKPPVPRLDKAGTHDKFQTVWGSVKAARHWLEYILVRAGISGLRLLGVDRASRISGKLWQALAPRTRRHQRALKHLALAFPEKSAAERDALARSMWNNLGRVAAEACMLDKILAEPSRLEILSPEIIAAVKEGGGRAVIASMHYGNWELGMWPFTQAGFESLALYQEAQNPFVDALIHKLRAPLLPGGLFGKGHGTPRKLLQAVKAGQPMAILADLRDHRGIEIDFFGRPAPTTPFPALVARQTGAVLIAGRVIRREGARFAMEGRIIAVPQTDDKNADILNATQALQSTFEAWIREHPEQWMWAHQRWGKGIDNPS